MATGRIEMGPTARTVADNLRRLREARGMSLRALSAELKRYGRTLSADAINKIENGRTLEPGTAPPKQIRRADVDDLAALALALNVSPLDLLLPPTAGAQTVSLTEDYQVTGRTAWQWAMGQRPAMDWEPGEGVSFAEPGADPAIAAENEERDQEFGRRRTEYKALALPEELRRAEDHPATRLLRDLDYLIERIIAPETGVDSPAHAARLRTAFRRNEQLRIEIEQLNEQGLEQLKRRYPGLISHVQVSADGTVTDVSEPQDAKDDAAPEGK